MRLLASHRMRPVYDPCTTGDFPRSSFPATWHLSPNLPEGFRRQAHPGSSVKQHACCAVCTVLLELLCHGDEARTGIQREEKIYTSEICPRSSMPIVSSNKFLPAPLREWL